MIKVVRARTRLSSRPYPVIITQNLPVYPYLIAEADRRGWCWYIPLHDGTTSIGVVQHQDTFNEKKKASELGLEEYYLSQAVLAPQVKELMGEKGEYVKGSVKQTADFSYHANTYSGDHFRIAGDAAAFVDPLFSSGVHAALTTALSAALTILGSLKGQVSEAEAQAWHDMKVGICQSRYELRLYVCTSLLTLTQVPYDCPQCIQGHAEPRHLDRAA
jgi:flavin-dependent dehydrogenase